MGRSAGKEPPWHTLKKGTIQGERERITPHDPRNPKQVFFKNYLVTLGCTVIFEDDTKSWLSDQWFGLKHFLEHFSHHLKGSDLEKNQDIGRDLILIGSHVDPEY